MKRFKAKKKGKLKIRYIIIIITVYFISKFTFLFFLNENIKFNNSTYLKLLLNESDKSIKYELDNNNIVNKLINLLMNFDIKNPNSIIDNTFNKVSIKKTNIDLDKYFLVSKETDYIKDPNPTQNNDYKIYIYNTHQLENYKKVNNENANVMAASFYLKAEFSKLGISALVEERRIKEIMNINNWSNYYKASKYLLEDIIKENKNLEYFIDLHRDSVSEKYTTLTMNNERYAKIYFVIGKENPKYEENMKLASLIDIKLNSKYKGISKGILLKEGKGVDGIYNQNLNSNILLVEFGGIDNTIEEVKRTISLFAQAYTEVINGK